MEGERGGKRREGGWKGWRREIVNQKKNESEFQR